MKIILLFISDFEIYGQRVFRWETVTRESPSVYDFMQVIERDYFYHKGLDSFFSDVECYQAFQTSVTQAGENIQDVLLRYTKELFQRVELQKQISLTIEERDTVVCFFGTKEAKELLKDYYFAFSYRDAEIFLQESVNRHGHYVDRYLQRIDDLLSYYLGKKVYLGHQFFLPRKVLLERNKLQIHYTQELLMMLYKKNYTSTKKKKQLSIHSMYQVQVVPRN